MSTNMAKFDFGLPIALFTIAAEQPADSLLACLTILGLFAA
jgi:hypothetical protein